MSLLVVGSIAIDSVETPQRVEADVLGGSASYFAMAASFFGPVRVVGVVGEDFPDPYLQVLRSRRTIDTSGIQMAAGKTFRWKGRYAQDMNWRDTLEVHLNVLEHFDPDLPENFRDSRYVFLANGSPVVQRKVLHQIRSPRLVVADTMDLWIKTQHDELLELFQQIDGIVLNDQEATLLTGESQIIPAGRKVLALGVRFVIIKKGEHGAILFSETGMVSLPAYPVSNVLDPTGAGDSFAGGLMGYLAESPVQDHAAFKRGIAYGTVTASITVEDFSLNRYASTSREEIENRYQLYRQMLRVE